MVTTLYSALSEGDITSPVDVVRTARDQELEFLGVAKSVGPGALTTVSLHDTMDDEGAYYRILDFQVQARWLDREGALWLQGGGFKVNLSLLTQERVAIFDRYLQGS